MLVSSSSAIPDRPPQQRQTSFKFLAGKIKTRTNEVLQRGKVGVNSASAMVEAIAAHPPNTGDGLTEREAKALSDKPLQQQGLLGTMMAQAQNGTLASDASTLLAVLKSATGREIDDREMLLERIVTMLQSLPADSKLQSTMTEGLLEMLWNDLPHPPESFLPASIPANPKGKGDISGPSTAFNNHRKADGSGNNPLLPTLGAANTPYARSVPPLHPANPNRPDPSVVFDALLKRDTFKPHPSGISSLLFSFATIIIHSCFQTSRSDPNINEASSYLDLSPLYGNNLDEQRTVRTFSQGQLHPDVIASSRLFFMPPSVVALLVMFSRNHNFICEKLYKINEKGKFKPLDSLTSEEKTKQDEDLFNTARLINCGYFLEIIVQDYIRVILNINRTESTWSLNPNLPIRQSSRGTGNAVSAEFNLVYRWHSAISEKDEKWIEGLFKQYCEDKPIDELTEKDFMTALAGLAKTQGKDPKTWTIPGIQRSQTGRFDDQDLAKILSDATEEVAGAFGANGSPAVMRVIDVLGMAAARNNWNVCTMNEFRRFLNLKPFSSFEEWNPDPKVANAARMLYGHTENLELFPGLHAEAAKSSRSGSGLATGYTISRAILSDAVALVRGDRFYTVDYNSATLTNWGYQDVQPDVEGGSYGGMIGKLLMRNLPNIYTPNSTYALFPFTIPSRMNGYLAGNGVLDKYDTRRPTRIPPIHGIFTHKACLDVLADPRKYGVIYEQSIKSCSNDYGYFISFDDTERHKADRMIQEKALFSPGWQDGLKSFYSLTTSNLIKEKSWSYDNNKTFNLDVVRDVTNLASVYWVSHQFGMPIKDSSKSPHGLFTPQELYLILSAFFISVFMNFDSTAGFKLSQAAQKAAPTLLAIIKGRLVQAKGVPTAVDDLARSLQDFFVGQNVEGLVMGKTAHEYYTRLLESGRPFDQLEASVQSTMTASVSNQGQAAAHVINFFLDDENSLHKEELVALIRLDTLEADQKILSLISEAMRLDPQVPLIPRVAREDTTIVDGDRTVNVKKGDFVFPSMLSAGMDPTVFGPDPAEVRARDPSLYRLFGSGMHTCLGARIVNISLIAMIKEVFSLPNIRRAPGAAGQLRRFHQDVGGTECPVYLDAKSSIWPLPVSLSVVYDSE